VVLSGAAVAWGFLASSARDTVAVECVIQGSDSIIPAASGDPVADCAAEWQRETGHSAPALVAYDSGEPMKTFFIVKGPLAWLDENGDVTGIFDVRDYIAMCRAHYEAVGIGADYVNSLFR
jgi:hypothetical protein